MEHLDADNLSEVGHQRIRKGLHRGRDVAVLQRLALVGLHTATDATAHFVRDQVKVDRLLKGKGRHGLLVVVFGSPSWTLLWSAGILLLAFSSRVLLLVVVLLRRLVHSPAEVGCILVALVVLL